MFLCVTYLEIPPRRVQKCMYTPSCTVSNTALRVQSEMENAAILVKIPLSNFMNNHLAEFTRTWQE
jgi:hypothetical protein